MSRQPVVHLVAVGVEVALKPLKEFLRMLRAPALLVFQQNDGKGSISIGPVEPHVALGPCGPAGFLQHLEDSLVSVEYISG